MLESKRKRPYRKRNRTLKVCVQCRKRKVKCDKKYPCTRCLKSHLKCKYLTKEEQVTNKEDTDEDSSPVATRLELLENEINELHSNDKAIRYNSDINVSLLDKKLPFLKKCIIISNHTGSNYLGPSCRMWLVVTLPALRQYMGEMMTIMGREKDHWLATHTSWRTSLDPFGEAHDENSLIKKVIGCNQAAFQERIMYFQTYLNPLIFNDCIPMDLVHSLFFRYFGSGSQSDNQKSEAFPYLRYGDISLITGIVYMSCLFTRLRDNQDELFRYKLTYKGSELFALFLRLLNGSKFRAHPTHVCLLSLLVLCESSLLCKGSVGTHREVDSFPIFQMCLDMCVQMGFHLDSKSMKPFYFTQNERSDNHSISQEQTRNVWNFVQAEDAFFSVMIGTPLLVDDRSCVEYLQTSSSPIQQFQFDNFKIQKEVAFIINSRASISVNMLVTQISKILHFCQSMPSIYGPQKGLSMQEADLDILAFVCRQKLVYLQLLQGLCRMVTDGISNLLNHTDIPQERLHLEKLSSEMHMKCLLAVVLSLYTVRGIVSGQTIFDSKSNGRYMVYFRDIISTVLGHCITIWFTYIIPEATGSLQLENEINHVKLWASQNVGQNSDEIITLPLLEQTMFNTSSKLEKNYEQEKLEMRVFLRLSSPSEMLKFADNTFTANKVMRSSFESFMTARSISVWVYMLKAIEECRELLKAKQITVLDIMNETKQRMMKEFDMSPENSSNNTSGRANDNLEEILDSVLKAPEMQHIGNSDLLDPEDYFNINDELMKACQNL